MSDIEVTPSEQDAAPAAVVVAPASEAATEAAGRPNARKVREGVVVSTAMSKTIVVAVTDRVRHPRYRKTMQRTTKFYAHDEINDASIGDRVRIVETRPLSKLKRWRLLTVLERAR